MAHESTHFSLKDSDVLSTLNLRFKLVENGGSPLSRIRLANVTRLLVLVPRLGG